MTDSAQTLATPPAYTRRRNRFLWFLAIAVFAIAFVSVAAYFINAYWPYRYRNVVPLLEGVLTSDVDIAHYHRTYFPYPGFVAEGLTLSRNSAPNLPPLGSARKLIVKGSWTDLLLLRKRVLLVDVVGMHIVIPPAGSEANHEDFPPGSSSYFAGPTTMVEKFRIHNAVLDLMRKNGSRFSYPIHVLEIRNLQMGHPISYSLDMENAIPSGHILAAGSFGPLTPQDLGATPVSGNFTFAPVNLSEIGNISGTLSAAGHFSGNLQAIEAYATTNTPNFAIGRGKPTGIAGSVQCAIDALNSDLVLHSIALSTGATTVHARGDSVGSPRVTNLDIAVAGGRAQDLLRPFLRSETPLVGAVWLKGHARVAPASQGARFLQRLDVNGSFDVPAERLTNRATEQTLSAFSRRAQSHSASPADPLSDARDAGPSADVLSSIEGGVKIRNGVVSTPHLTVQVPGAAAILNGSYNLSNHDVHLTGDLRMQANISHITTGFKSFLLKPLIPFFKKPHAGAVIPIAITGSPNNYKVSQDIFHTK